MVAGAAGGFVAGAAKASARIDVHDDALGIGRLTEGSLRQIRRSIESIVDRAIAFAARDKPPNPARAARQEGKALLMGLDVLREADATLDSCSPQARLLGQLLATQYARRLMGADSPAPGAADPDSPAPGAADADSPAPGVADTGACDAGSVPCDLGSSPSKSDWLRTAFDRMADTSGDELESLWARLRSLEGSDLGRPERKTRLPQLDARLALRARRALGPGGCERLAWMSTGFALSAAFTAAALSRARSRKPPATAWPPVAAGRRPR